MTLTPQRRYAVHQYRHENFGWREHGNSNWSLNTSLRVVEHHAEWGVTLETSLMDRLIDWKLRSPATARKLKTSAISEEDHLIRQFTVELRVNYADNDKNDVMRRAVAAAARHIFATAQLLADGTNPDIAIFSDDWFAGREEIKLLDDVIQQGLDEAGENIAEGEVSSELMSAVRDSTP